MTFNIKPTTPSQYPNNRVALTERELPKEVKKYVYTQQGQKFLPLPGDRIGLQDEESGKLTSVFDINRGGDFTSIRQWSDDKEMTTIRVDKDGNVLKAGGISFAKTSNTPTIDKDNNNEVNFPDVEWQVSGNRDVAFFHRVDARMEQDQATEATPPKE